MPKILIAATELNRIGGMASHLQHTAAELKKRGWEVHCLATNVRGDYFEEISRRYTAHDFSSFPLSSRKVFMAADLANSLDPDIILLNNCALMQYALPLLNPAIKSVGVLHSDDDRFYAIAAVFPEAMFRWIAPVVHLKEQFQEFLPEKLREKIRVIPHGIDSAAYSPGHRRDDSNAFQILFVGFLGESKGAHLLPDIFERVSASLPQAFLTIVGDGPLREKLDSEFQRRSLQKKVIFRGGTVPSETADIMRASHVLLLPTLLEGFGLVIIEAMACGVVPVISLLKGITDDIVMQGETGFLVAPRDIKGFSEAVTALGTDKGKRTVISQKARSIAAAKFSAARMVDQYEPLFAEADDRAERRRSTIPGWYVRAGIQYIAKRLR